MTPVVSVILPTYNRREYLQQAIEGVQAQTCTAWELIVADDGSTDDTREYLSTLHDARVKVLALEHRGVAACVRNAAVAHATGEWIAVLDSDDLWLPTKLATQLTLLAALPACGWSCTAFQHIDAAGRSIPQRSGRPYRAQSGWVLPELLTFDVTAATSSLLVQRTLLTDVGAFDPAFRFRDDHDLELRLAARSPLAAAPEMLTLIRDHDGRMTSGQRVVDLVSENIAVLEKTYAWLTNERAKDICARQCALHWRQLAWLSSRAGNHRQALQQALTAWLRAPRVPSNWRTLLAVLARSVGVTHESTPTRGG